MDRLERLINLMAALLAASRPLTRAELFERVPGYPAGEAAFRRAFERDKDALRSMGIPISVEPVDAGAADSPDGYRVRREQYELPDPDLTSDELAALHLAVSAVRIDQGGDTEAALWKLGGAPATVTDEASVALSGSDHLALLFSAVSERRTVTFLYRGEKRTVDPWRLAFRAGRWYLTGADHRRGFERRGFRLDRMGEPEVVGPAGTFERPAGASAEAPPSWALGDEDPVDAFLLVDADQADWATGFLGADQVVEHRDDGSIVYRLRVTNRRAFRSLVVGFLDHAEVLGPGELRDDLVAWLNDIVAAT